LAKKTKWGNPKLQLESSDCNGFYLHDAIGTVFNEDDGTWDNGMVKVYDNFSNDFLYPNPDNILYLPKIMIQTASMKYKNDFKKI
jgi:hypothetical protein